MLYGFYIIADMDGAAWISEYYVEVLMCMSPTTAGMNTLFDAREGRREGHIAHGRTGHLQWAGTRTPWPGRMHELMLGISADTIPSSRRPDRLDHGPARRMIAPQVDIDWGEGAYTRAWRMIELDRLSRALLEIEREELGDHRPPAVHCAAQVRCLSCVSLDPNCKSRRHVPAPHSQQVMYSVQDMVNATTAVLGMRIHQETEMKQMLRPSDGHSQEMPMNDGEMQEP
ncbi:hypothetical protein NM688_g7505 [Phlebia brevispora]|uniref:Uncharacterized protein n=1 Tax=Phlebia brevispora TaxID=194682 RepID=A0ACC1S4F2_9APHY|nr:hypothetical protein NM688_g7505 [Phlebia brevispora]